MGKYDEFTRGEEEALLNRLGGVDIARAVGSGKYTVKIVGKEVQLAEVVEKLFDRHGRRIPPPGLCSAVCDANREFKLAQPKPKSLDDYAARLTRLQTYMKPGSFISVAEFHGRSQKLLTELKANPRLANLANGVCLPFSLPPMKVEDYGKKLDEMLDAFGLAYAKEYPGLTFYNHRHGELKGKVEIVAGTRHERLITALAKGTVVGLYFPNPLQGFSIPAAREQMSTLPDELILAGGLDTVANLIMYPDVLAKNFQTPGLDCAALSWDSADYSLSFRARDDFAYFAHRYLYAHDYYSAGLVLLG